MTREIRTPWMAVTAMFVLNGALFGIWASRIPAVAQRHGLGPADLGGLLLLMAAGAIIAFPLAGRMSDKLGAAKITRLIAVAYVGALYLVALSPSYVLLAVSLLVFGATHGAMDVAMNSWAGEVERHTKRPVMSSFHAMFSLGAGLGAASGFVAASFDIGIAPHFITTGTAVAALTLAIAANGWISETRATGSGVPMFSLPKGRLLAVGFVAFCASLGEGAMADWSAIFLVLVSGASEANAALGYTVFALTMVLVRLMGDRITLQLGAVVTARFAGAISVIGVLCAVIFGTYTMSLVGFALMGIGYAVVMPLAFTRAANDPNTSPGAAIASVSTLGYGGLLLGPPLIGLASELSSIRVAFLILAVLASFIVIFAKAVSK